MRAEEDSTMMGTRVPEGTLPEALGRRSGSAARLRFVAVVLAVVTFFGTVGGAVVDVTAASAATTPQAITFTSTAPSLGVIGSTYTVSATGGSSGNAVTFTIDGISTSGACTISGSTVSFTGQGSCVIDANQSSGGSYAAAPQEQQSIDVNYASSCAVERSTFPTDGNGTYTLELLGAPESIYCANMTTSPTEYVTLAATGSGNNYSEDGAEGLWSSSNGDLVTSYTKVRINPANLLVNETDDTYSTSSGGPITSTTGATWSAISYALGGVCNGNTGAFNVNLTGTGFNASYGTSELHLLGTELHDHERLGRLRVRRNGVDRRGCDPGGDDDAPLERVRARPELTLRHALCRLGLPPALHVVGHRPDPQPLLDPRDRALGRIGHRKCHLCVAVRGDLRSIDHVLRWRRVLGRFGRDDHADDARHVHGDRAPGGVGKLPRCRAGRRVLPGSRIPEHHLHLDAGVAERSWIDLHAIGDRWRLAKRGDLLDRWLLRRGSVLHLFGHCDVQRCRDLRHRCESGR
jgi:hypothetical protein